MTNTPWLNIALPKGRLGEKAYNLLKMSGYECPAIEDPGRKLIFENPAKKVRYFWVKPSDVAIYVERGAADLGIVGKDILLEQEPDVYELLDLQMGKCRDIDIIHLNGSIEIAPILGLSHVIVDIVETGKTLAENNLAVLAEVVPISARLIANVASYQFKEAAIWAVRDNLKIQLEK